MADSSYLLRKTHCLMPLSFVSRQCLKLWIELSFNQPAVTPTTEESTGQVLVWPHCHFPSCQPRRSNPSTCDSACAPGPWCCWPQQALLHGAAWVQGQSARGPSEPRHGTGACASPQPAKTKELFSREETASQVAFSAYVKHLQPWGKQWQHTLRKTCCSLHRGFIWCRQDLNDTSTACFLYSPKEN